MALAGGAMPLVVGTALAICALAFVLAPLVSDWGKVGNDGPRKGSKARLQTADFSAKTSARTSMSVEALREIEFDRATGKLSDTDYSELKRRYTILALEELRGRDVISTPDVDVNMDAGPVSAAGAASNDSADPVEAAIGRARANQRVCGTCGPRNEPDAVYCSGCGHYLAGRCRSCGTEIDAPGARYCSGCGSALAA